MYVREQKTGAHHQGDPSGCHGGTQRLSLVLSGGLGLKQCIKAYPKHYALSESFNVSYS